MRSRFLCCLFASVIFHLVVFLLPFSATMGGLERNGMRPVRVHLLSGGDQSEGDSTGKAGSSLDAPKAADNARQLSGSTPAAHDRSKEKKIEPEADAFSRTDEIRREMRSVRQATHPPKKAVANSSTPVSRRDERPANTDAVSRPNTADSNRTQETRPKRQTVLRTTTVYTGSGSAAPAQRSNGNAANDAANKTPATSAASGREPEDGSQQAHSGRVSQVRYAKVVKPDYPEEARVKGWEGTTILRVLVNRAGKSEDIQIHHSSGFNLLDDAAVEALWLWEFHPARHGPKEVQSWVNIPIVFNLKEDD